MDPMVANPPSSAGTASSSPGANVWKNFFLTAGFGEAASQHYSDVFKAQEMEIDMLGELTHELLLQIGVTKAGHRIKILRLSDAVVRTQTGEIVSESSDSYLPLASFSYAGRVYHLTSAPEANLSVSTSTQTSAIPITTKQFLIPVTFDKKRSMSGSAGGDHGVPRPEPIVRPSSTASMSGIGLSASSSVISSHSDSSISSHGSNGHYASAPASPDHMRRVITGTTIAPIMYPSPSDIQVMIGDADSVVTEGTYMVNPETGEVVPSPTSSPQSHPNNHSPPPSAVGSSPSAGHGFTSPSPAVVLRYFMNDEVAKHRVRLFGEATVRTFTLVLKVHHKLSQGFAVFTFDMAENRLRVLKDTTPVDSTAVYYVLENSRIDDLYRKVEKRVKKDLAALGSGSGKSGSNLVWNSENNPLQVDFIPDSELYLTEAGRIGLCMCPGRQKKKAAHEWDRDLEKDLLRIHQHYKADVVVSLVRRSELVELRIPNLIEEIERHGMESIWFPIKDKWIPESMADLIRLVDALVTRLKNGKTLVIHCNGGKGRSGTVAVACMVAMGQRVDKSIDVVRKARSGTIRNPVQIVYVKRFKSAFKKFTKKKKALIEARGGSASMPKEEWDALAQQVAADAVLESSSSSESDAISLEQGASGSTGASRSSFALQKKYKKEEEKAHEKQRKEEEKASEKARKEEEKNRKEEEKAAEKARKEDEKANEKARKGEEKAAIKVKKDDSKRGSMQLSASFDSDVPSTMPPTSTGSGSNTGSGKTNKSAGNHAKANSTNKRSSTEVDEEAALTIENQTAASLPLSADPSQSALLAPIAESPGRAMPAPETKPHNESKSNDTKPNDAKPKTKAPKQEKRVDTPAPYAVAPTDANATTLDNNHQSEASAATAPTSASTAATTTAAETSLSATEDNGNGSSTPPVPRSNSKKKAKRTVAVVTAEEAALSGAGSE